MCSAVFSAICCVLLATLDHEVAYIDAQIYALARPGQGQRDVALGDDLCGTGLDHAGMRLGGRIGAQQIIEAVCTGEGAAAAGDLGLADC